MYNREWFIRLLTDYKTFDIEYFFNENFTETPCFHCFNGYDKPDTIVTSREGLLRWVREQWGNTDIEFVFMYDETQPEGCDAIYHWSVDWRV